jgi:hypothetical protein
MPRMKYVERKRICTFSAKYRHSLKLLTFRSTTRHSLALGLARSIREPRLRGGYPLQLCKLISDWGWKTFGGLAALKTISSQTIASS